MKSFVYCNPRGNKPPPLCSIYTGFRGRDEPRFNSETWANQTISVEVVVVESGPKPFTFPDYDDMDHIDKYIFCYQPEDSVHAVCWWRNVGAWNCSCKMAIQVDCDIAMAPNAAKAMLDLATANPGAFVHPTRIGSTETRSTGRYSDFVIDREIGNYEAIWMFDLDIFKQRGGWNEAYTGPRDEMKPFNKTFEDVKQIRENAKDIFCHVPHQLNAARYPEPARNPDRSYVHTVPLMPWLPAYSLEKKWPDDYLGWTPGSMCLCEDLKA